MATPGFNLKAVALWQMSGCNNANAGSEQRSSGGVGVVGMQAVSIMFGKFT